MTVLTIFTIDFATLSSISIFQVTFASLQALMQELPTLKSNVNCCPDNDSLETKLSDLKPWEFPEQITPEQSEQEQDKTLKIIYYIFEWSFDQ